MTYVDFLYLRVGRFLDFDSRDMHYLAIQGSRNCVRIQLNTYKHYFEDEAVF